MCDGSCYRQGRDCECFVELNDYSDRVEGTLSFLANMLMVLMTVLFLFVIFYYF